MRKKSLVFVGFLTAALITAVIFAYPFLPGRTESIIPSETTSTIDVAQDIVESTSTEPEIVPDIAPTTTKLTPPISDALRRVTKKTFGLEIVAGHSPVENDRFSGFHVGVDFETFEDEQGIDVPIVAICAGPLRFKKFATGYGGVAVQKCVIDGEAVSVIYGHLNVESVTANAGDELEPGQFVGNLGKGYSAETDGVRKHLHLGIRRGETTDIRGYTPNKEEIGKWLDVIPLITLLTEGV